MRCQHCNAVLAEVPLENGRTGYLTTDGSRHECPVLVEQGVRRCEYCGGRIAFWEKWNAYDMDGKPHLQTCKARIHQQTAPAALKRNRKK